MKKIFAPVILAWLLCLILAPAVQADVLISELCDPRNDYLTDRYIEIYNTGPGAVDLTGWQIVAVGNGVDIFTWNLSGSIASGQALVAANQTTVDVFPIDFPAAGWSASNATWNGKVGDGARLKNETGLVLDDIVVPGTTFENNALERNENITAPNLVFTASEWTATPIFTPSEASPGMHHPVVSQGPVLGAITTLPALPVAGQAVDIQAVVTDGAANITTVSLVWGTVPAVLTNPVTMTTTGPDTWTTAVPIPAQTAGTTVYYQVTANNDVPAATVSAELNYNLPVAATVQDIQGIGAVSPLAGTEVVTAGVVTAAFGSSFVIQNGTGQRSGLWVEGTVAPALGALAEIRGVVQELDGNTTVTGATVISTASGGLPLAAVLTTGAAAGEDWEGVLAQVVGAACTQSDPTTLVWAVDNNDGPLPVDDLGVLPGLVLGTSYTVTGPLNGSGAAGGIVPRDAGDIVFVADTVAPVVLSIEPLGSTSIRVTFSEELTAGSAGNNAYYTLAGGTVTAAVQDPGQPAVVTLTVTAMNNGNQTLAIDGLEDLFGNTMVGVVEPFYFYGGDIPLGYYDPAQGLTGEVLRGALHDIIDGHTSISYSGLWTAFYTTDDKANGKVWDMYSDIPGGTPPYEYTFGTDQGGSAGSEGSGYNREHSWPSSWYGAVSPMYTDLFMVYPTDNEVNNRRGSFPFGEVDAGTWTSLNGCQVGPCSYPGYTGTVFEPIDEYKGDFARAYFYMSTRYFGDDGGWAGSDMTSGSQLLPWAEAMLLEWHAADPVSSKEINRNEAVYAIQSNRNPYIDRPEFVTQVFQPELSPVPQPGLPAAIVLHQNVPNPFNPSTVIAYEVDVPGMLALQVFDVAGRLVRNLYRGNTAAGSHEKTWLGRDDAGRSVATGVYFYRLQVGGETETRRMLLVK